MYKIFLADNSLSGHHEVYLKTILQLENTENSSFVTKFGAKKTSIKYYSSRLAFFKRIKLCVQNSNFNVNKKVLHFLYIDNLYTVPYIKLNLPNTKIVGTLHHYPQNKIKMKMLKRFSKSFEVIIVHSDYIRKKLHDNGIYNVEVIPYPSFFNYTNLPNSEVMREKFNIPNNLSVFTLLGGTRFDKGLDLFLSSFNHIPTEMKKKILVNIVGKEETFDRNYINKLATMYDINIRSHYGYVSDEDFISNIIVSDYIVLPYKKIFTGNSGPMTEAIRNGIPVIGPNYGNIGHLIEKHKLGYTFQVEDAISLAEVTVKALNDKKIINNDYKNALTVDAFLESHKNLYDNLVDNY